MASISGVQGGLGYLAPVIITAPKTPKPKRYVAPDLEGIEGDCKACTRFVHAYKKGRAFYGLRDGMCQHCATFFGFGGHLHGCTDTSPADALKRINDVRRDGFAMILRSFSLGAPDGATVSMNAGDIFPCMVKNPVPTSDGEPSKENTWALFMLDVDIGPYPARFFPHEFASIGLASIMEMKNRGEIVEHFTSAEDKSGHFTPTPALRQMIEDTFGRLVR